MHRRMDIKSLRALAGRIEGERDIAGLHKEEYDRNRAALNTPEQKKMYTAEHLQERRREQKSNVLKSIRDISQDLAARTVQAEKERPLWDKKAIFLDSYRASDSIDRGIQASEQSTAATQGLRIARRLERMSDDQFQAFIRQAVRLGDTQALILAAEEGEVRGGVAGEAARQAVDAMPSPIADEADVLYESMKNNLEEIEAYIRNVEKPDDNNSHAVIESNKIKRKSAEDAADGDKKSSEGNTMLTPHNAPDLDFTNSIHHKS